MPIEKLKKLTNNNHQGIVCQISKIKIYNLNDLDLYLQNKDSSRLAFLDGITDTKNFGSIIRNAECFGIDGIVITHGTATLEETAYFLHLTIKSNKPVVLTGAMRPPSSMSTDADINLLDAIRIASSGNAQNMGVMGVLNNQIHSAREIIKMNTLRVDTFQSNDLGFLGFVDSDGQVIFYRNSIKTHTYESEFSTQGLDQLPRVDIVVAYSGGDGLLIDAVKKNASQGLILAGFGSGTLPTVMKDSALELVKDGIPVVLASRSIMGRIVLTEKFRDEGFITCDNLSPQKARILLMLSFYLAP